MEFILGATTYVLTKFDLVKWYISQQFHINISVEYILLTIINIYKGYTFVESFILGFEIIEKDLTSKFAGWFSLLACTSLTTK